MAAVMDELHLYVFFEHPDLGRCRTIVGKGQYHRDETGQLYVAARRIDGHVQLCAVTRAMPYRLDWIDELSEEREGE